MLSFRNRSRGFTIAELLVVITVIAILAAITVVTYQGITNRADDAAVQSDLKHLAASINDSVIPTVPGGSTAAFPSSTTALKQLEIKVTKSAYGHPLVASGYSYNLLYCYTTPGDAFALVGSSASGNVFYYSSKTNTITSLASSSWTSGYGVVCPAVLGSSESTVGIWFYNQGAWQSFVSN